MMKALRHSRAPSTGGISRRRLEAGILTTCLVLLVVWRMSAMPGMTRPERICNPNLVVVLTSHKTGTAQAGCIKGQVVLNHGLLDADLYENEASSVHVISDFAGTPRHTTDGSEYCPPAAVYTSGHYIARTEDEFCPRRLPCPCTGKQLNCSSLEPGTLDIPPGNTTVIQVIRSPIDIILSAYLYHIQVPAPEAWIDRTTIHQFGRWLLEEGVPREMFGKFGVFFAPADEGYGSFLRRLPKGQGIKMEFWRSTRGLYGFARQHASLMQRNDIKFLPLRFEDLQSNFNSTARSMLEAFHERIPQVNVASMMDIVQQCHVANWDQQQLAADEHVTSSKNPVLRKNLRAVLMADTDIAPRLCQLCETFGYEEPECHGVGGAARGTSGEATDEAGAAIRAVQ